MDTVAVISRRSSGLAIAAAAAIAGYDVVLVPMDEGPTAECLRRAVRARTDGAALPYPEGGELDGAGRGGASAPLQGAGRGGASALARMCIRPALEAIGECALVVDCVGPDDPVERTALLRRLEACMTYGAVLATADPTYERFGPALARPTQFLGLAFDPDGARIEALPTADTAPGVAESARLFCRALERPLAVPTAA
jgi:hypothetical protein